MLVSRTISILEKVAAAQAAIAAPVQEHKTGIPSMKPWFEPYAHQKAAVGKLYNNKGKLLLAHAAGTGKTATSIYAVEKMRHEGRTRGALVVVPSGLRANFGHGGVKKFTTSDFQIIGNAGEKKADANVVLPSEVAPGKPYTIVSYAQFRRDPVGFMQRSGADTLLFDEAHRTRNERAQTFKAAIKARALATNVIAMTASPINNDPAEIATLLTITEGRRIVSPAEFRRLFVKTVGFTKGFSGGKKKVQDLKNHPELLQLALPRVDLVSGEDLKGKTMPRRDLESVDVPMSKEQHEHYQLALNKLGPLKKYLMRRDQNLSMKEAKFVFTSLMQARQVSNSMHTARKDITPAQSAERTPKMKRLIGDTVAHLDENPSHKVVLYSNLVRGGVDVMAAGLRARGIEPALFVGKGTNIGKTKVTGPVRQQGVKDYKDGKKRVIIISGAGAEGLDLKNSTAFFAADGHFNPEVIVQSEARARRLGGQEFRKPEDRVVKVRRYKSVMPASAKPGFLGRMMGKKTPQSTDEWVYNVAGRKARKTKAFKSTMRTPHKYIRKYTAASGRTVYVYPNTGKQQEPKKSGWKFWE